MPQERLVQRVMWVITAVLLVAGVLSAAIVGGDDDSDDAATNASSTTTTLPLAASPDAGAATTTPATPQAGGPGAPAGTSPRTTTAPGVPGGPGTTAPANGGTQPQPQQSDFRDLGAVDDPGATQVPAAGKYTYRFTDDSGEAHDATTTIDDKGAAGNGSRRMTITYSGEGLDLINDALWGPDDLVFTKTTFVFNGQRFECDWTPDYRSMPLKLARGTTWEAKSSCTLQAGATTAVVSRSTSARVTDARRVHVAGGEVLTWVIEGNDHLEFPGQGSLDTKETTWFAPKLGLAVRQVGETKSSDADDDGTKSEMVITRLTPV